MKRVSEMIGVRGVGGDQRYYMREAICNDCGDKFNVEITMKSAPKCVRCKRRMRLKWEEIDKPDYSEYRANYDTVKKPSRS